MNKKNFCDNEFSPGFFISKDGEAMIAVYVDDCLLAAKTEEKLDELVEMLTEGFELKSTGAVNEDGMSESDVLGMDLSYDVKKGIVKLSLEKYFCTISKDSEGFLAEEKAETEVLYLQKCENVDPRKEEIKLTPLHQLNLTRNHKLLDKGSCASSHNDDQEEVYVSKKRKQEFLTKTLEELLNKPIDSYNNTQGSLPTLRRPANSSQDLSSLNSRFANFNLEDSSCQTTVPAQEQTTLLQKSASQADTRATIPLGEQVNPLDDFITHDDRWSASDISFRGSTPVSSDSHNEDHCSGPTQNALCFKQDSIGPYVTFTTRNGRRHKFYTRTLGNYLRTKLNRIEDYPQWCWLIRNFSSTFQFDDITLLSGIDKIPLDENLLLREILLKSVGERDMERYFLHHNDILKIFSTIRLEYQKRFTTSIRDKTWSTISIGRECPDRCRRCEMVLREQGAA